jgi:hypothetical protein
VQRILYQSDIKINRRLSGPKSIGIAEAIVLRFTLRQAQGDSVILMFNWYYRINKSAAIRAQNN